MIKEISLPIEQSRISDSNDNDIGDDDDTKKGMA